MRNILRTVKTRLHLLVGLWMLTVCNSVLGIACASLFSNGIQATSSTGNIALSFRSAITGGTATLNTPTLSDSSAWAACSGSTCVASRTPAPRSAPTFTLGTSANGNIIVPFQSSGTYASGDYGTVSVAQEGTLKFNNTGLHLTKGFTTGFRSEVWLRSGDYWIDGNLSLGQETVLRRVSPTGTTRIFVRGNISMGFRVITRDFASDQLSIYATGSIIAENEANLSGFIYGAGNVSFGFMSVINGAVSGANFTATGNQVTVNYQPASFTTGNFSPLCSGSASLDHYELQLAPNSVACLGADVTVRACADNASPCTVANNVNTNVTLSTTAGTLDTSTLTLAAGVATTKLKHPGASDGSLTTVTLSGEQTAAPNARRCCTGTSSCVVANSCNITFNTAGFAFSNSATTSGTIPTHVAGVTGSSIYLRAVQTNTATGACTARLTSPHDVPLAFQCRNPTTCVSGQTLNVNGVAVSPNNDGASSITYANVPLSFDSQGSAPLALNYSDVGQVRLLARLSLPATTADPAYVLSGTSNDFVVKPHTLAVSSVLTATGGANPGGTSAAGTAAGFVPAGTPFQIRVESRRSPGTSSNDVTPNFGREMTPEHNNMRLVEATLVYPSGGTLTALSGAAGNSFSTTTPSGTFINTTVAWNQVGSITVRPELTDSDYLGAGNVAATTTSGTIGRFYPARYSLSTATNTNSCTAFSYMGQPGISLSYQVVAQGSTGSTLTNYGGNYASATTIATPVYVAENADQANGASLSPRVTPGTTPTWSNGLLTLSSSTASFQRQSGNAAPDGPYASLQWGMDIEDNFDGRSLEGKNMNATTSGACSATDCTAVALGLPLALRYGRLRFDSAFGPESVALPVTLITEYWTGSYFVQNSQDQCTEIPRAAVNYPNGNLTNDSNRTVTLSSGTTQGMYANINATGIRFNSGTAGHYFSQPSAGGTGSFQVGIDLSSLGWLRFDWNQDGNHTDATVPPATFTFGSYRGHDRVIYWREKFN